MTAMYRPSAEALGVLEALVQTTSTPMRGSEYVTITSKEDGDDLEESDPGLIGGFAHTRALQLHNTRFLKDGRNTLKWARREILDDVHLSTHMNVPDEQSRYDVERILDKKVTSASGHPRSDGMRKTITWYLVRWKGQSAKEDQWLNSRTPRADHPVDEFHMECRHFKGDLLRLPPKKKALSMQQILRSDTDLNH